MLTKVVEVDFFDACTIYECLKFIVDVAELDDLGHHIASYVMQEKAPVVAKAYHMISKWEKIKEELSE